jgi:hypothetical protein
MWERQFLCRTVLSGISNPNNRTSLPSAVISGVHISDPRFRDIFLGYLERSRLVFRFRVYGYVIMPDHLHVLVSEPKLDVLATAIQALKVSFTNLLGVES